MTSKNQMKRGKTQSLYKYLPEEWIDFAVRGKERKQYIAQVVGWNSEKLTGVNIKRIIRSVSEAVESYRAQAGAEGTIQSTVGFGFDISQSTYDVLTPKASDEERGIVARISPLTFYCKKCYKVYQFSNYDYYKNNKYCLNPNCGHSELAQFRQIYFCKCGYATDKHPAYCKEHGYKFIKWDGHFNFICTQCNKKISMQVTCPSCREILRPKNALDPAQFFVYSLSLIDLIDIKLEEFITSKEYGPYLTFAYWLGKITKDEYDNIVKKGLISDPEEYKKVFKTYYDMMFACFHDEGQAEMAAKVAADKQCGSEFQMIIDDMKGSVSSVVKDILSSAESILEYKLVTQLEDVSDLGSAINVAKLLNTNANPEKYIQVARDYGIKSACVCDKIPFISCSYGYTRVESEYKNGVQLHALKEEVSGRKNVYATKLNTEGVLFEFDRKKIIQWLISNKIIESENAPNIESEEELKLWFINNIKPSLIHPFSEINENESKETYYVYRLIHSISHLLIRAAANIGGLGKDSLSEYIFPVVPAVLIYCQNSQGFNLGSLYNTFEAYFDKWINEAFKNAHKCIFDPICVERYKACAGCLFVNEVSCQHFNKDLDRTLVIGHVDRKTQRKIYSFWEE